jgi:hypothetical protein
MPLVLLTVLLAGCTPRWSRPDTSPADRAADLNRCATYAQDRVESQRQTAANLQQLLTKLGAKEQPPAFDAGQVYDHELRACMTADGYTAE